LGNLLGKTNAESIRLKNHLSGYSCPLKDIQPEAVPDHQTWRPEEFEHQP